MIFCGRFVMLSGGNPRQKGRRKMKTRNMAVALGGSFDHIAPGDVVAAIKKREWAA